MQATKARTGDRSPFQGQWVCTSCGEEITVMSGEALPQCPHENEDASWEALAAVAPEAVTAAQTPGAPGDFGRAP
jgi:hypothetical protein